MQHYRNTNEENVGVLDLVVSGLPPDTQVENLKKLSGSKHIISCELEVDNFRGTCKGSGRIQMRLNHGETKDQVKLNFTKLGLTVKDFEQDPRKKPIVTGTPKEAQRERVDHRFEKQSFLTTQNPDMFGTSARFAPQERPF